jgi:hypothetical protein
MANITLLGASYTDVPAVDLPKTGGGTVRFYEDEPSDLGTKTITLNGTYSAEDDNVDGYSEVTVNVQGGASMSEVQNQYGTEVIITSAPGSAPSATRHTLYYEYEDETTETVYAYYDDALIGPAITATKPTTHNNKTVTLAQLDGTTWYSYNPSVIPLNTQLVDFSTVTDGYIIDSNGAEMEYEWGCATDYIRIDPTMTFSYIGNQWFYIGFYDSSKSAVGAIYMYDDATTKDGDAAYGTLTPAKIPASAQYVRLSSTLGAGPNDLSLIRTA